MLISHFTVGGGALPVCPCKGSTEESREQEQQEEQEEECPGIFPEGNYVLRVFSDKSTLSYSSTLTAAVMIGHHIRFSETFRPEGDFFSDY